MEAWVCSTPLHRLLKKSWVNVEAWVCRALSIWNRELEPRLKIVLERNITQTLVFARS